MCFRAVSILFGALVVVWPLVADGGTVRTRDGKTYQGDARLDGGKVVVKPESGDEIHLDLGEIAHAVFRHAPGTSGKPAQSKPDPKIKPRPARIEGLRAEYFADTELKDLRLTRVDPSIDFYWPDQGSPDPAVPKDFSVRWTGHLQPLYTERYTLYLRVNDGGRVWIDDKLIIDHWAGSPGELRADVDLVANRKHAIKVEFKDTSYAGSARLAWSSRQQSSQMIPPARLYPPEETVPPTIRITYPSADTLFIAPQPVTIEAELGDEDGRVARMDVIADGEIVGAVNSAPWRFEWKDASPGWHKIALKVTDNTGISASTDLLPIAVASDSDGTLPTPWGQMPIGAKEQRGGATFTRGEFTLEGMGQELWGEQDVFRFIFQKLSGDGAITARLTRFDVIEDDAASAGILFREHISSTPARQAFLGFVPEMGLVFMRRENVWDERKVQDEPGHHAPIWLRLSRHGTLVRADYSEDGRKWVILSERKLELPDEIYAGLVIAHGGMERGKAVFDNVAMAEGSPEVASSIRGILLRNGSLIAGNIHRLDDTSVRLQRKEGELVIPASQVARLLFYPVTADAAQRLKPGRTGVLLGSGDFVDGDVNFKDGQVRVSSVLFGSRTFNTWDQTVAIVLAEPRARPGQFEIRTADGSIIQAAAVEPYKSDRLRIRDQSDVLLTCYTADLLEIRAPAR